MKRKLKEFLEDNNIIPARSFGFQRGLSTITGINYLSSKIMQIRSDKKIAVLISIDLQGAYDRVKTKKLREKLIAYGVCYLDLQFANK